MDDKQDTGTLELDELEYYIVIGVEKEGRKSVTVASPNITLPDMGAMLGRLQANYQLQLTQAALHQYQEFLRKKAHTSQIIKGVPPLNTN